MPIKNRNNLAKIEKLQKYELFILIGIIIISIFFRFYNLRTNPKWYSDEFVYMNAAWNLIHGSFQIGNITWTFFTPVLPNPPLYSIINGFLLLIKYDIVVMRMWVAFCGVLTTILLYFVGKELANKKVGLLSAFFFAIYPLAIMTNRRAWPHNQAMLFITIAFYSCLKYKNTLNKKWLYSVIISCGLACLTSYWVIGLLLFVFGFFFFVDKKQLKIVLPSIVSFFVIFFVLAFLKFGEQLIFDIKSTLAMTTLLSENNNFFLLVIYDYFNFFKIDYFIALGCIGLFFTSKRDDKIALVSLFILLSFEILRQRDNIPLYFYPAIILVPLICVGLGVLLNYLSLLSTKFTNKRLSNLILIALMLAFSPAIIKDFKQTLNGFSTPLDILAVSDYMSTEDTGKFINNNVVGTDLVLASFNVGWLLKCKTTDILFSAVQENKTNDIFPRNMDNKRFVFDGNYEKAKYFITDNLTGDWTETQNGVIDIMHNMEFEGWKKVFKKGEYSVFANPLFSKEKEKGLDVIIENTGEYNKIAKKFYMAGMYDDAALELDKALIVSPNDEFTRLHLAKVYLTKGMKMEARKEYKKVLQTNPSSQEALKQLNLLNNK